MVRPVRKKKNREERVHECIGYVRVSTKGQAEYGVSLDTQRKMILEFCNDPKNNCRIDPERIYIDEGKSAFKQHNKRTGYLNAKRDIETGRGDTLVVYSLSRAFRTMNEAIQTMQLLKDKDANIISVTERGIDTTTKTGKLLYNLISVLSEFESEQTSERVRDNMLHHFEIKGYVGQRRPTGYKFIKERKEEFKNGQTYSVLRVVKPFYLKHDNGEREITQKVFEMYKNGIGQRLIKKETGLTLSVVGWMLSNPVYCGYLLLVTKDGDYRLKKGWHEPYITREEFNKNVDRRIKNCLNGNLLRNPPIKIRINCGEKKDVGHGKPYIKFLTEEDVKKLTPIRKKDRKRTSNKPKIKLCSIQKGF